MNERFNLYSRTEEEKTADILIYEKKARAKEICGIYERINKKASLAELIAAVILCAVGLPVFYRFYDTESIMGMVITVLCIIALTVLARLLAGAVLCRSVSSYVKLGKLCDKWTYSRKTMHELEERFADQTVYEGDIKKAEERLIKASDALIDFAEQNSLI